jgi:uncharacterized protein DUF1569
MKTVFDKTTRDELTVRIKMLDENETALWGKMNVYQMLKHCTLWDEWIQSSKNNKRAFVGLLFGRIALRSVMKDESPLTRNTPTLPELIVKETSGDIVAEKKKWTTLIDQYAHYSKPGFVHTFFGKMTREQVGYMAYKHADHHLRQFNC